MFLKACYLRIVSDGGLQLMVEHSAAYIWDI